MINYRVHANQLATQLATLIVVTHERASRVVSLVQAAHHIVVNGQNVVVHSLLDEEPLDLIEVDRDQRAVKDGERRRDHERRENDDAVLEREEECEVARLRAKSYENVKCDQPCSFKVSKSTHLDTESARSTR